MISKNFLPKKNKIFKDLKVCMLIPTPTAFPTSGGFENLVYMLSQQLSKKITVHVVCLRFNPDFRKPINFHIHVLPSFLKIKYIGYLINIIFNSFAFYFISKRERFDIIHSHSVTPGGFIATPTKVLLKIPLICTSHGSDIQIDKNIGYGARRNPFINFSTKFILKLTDIHTVVSESMINDAISSGSDRHKIRVIFNGIDFEEIKKFKKPNKQIWNLNHTDFIVLFFGRLHPKKRPEDLLYAFSLIVNDFPFIKLIFAGEGSEEKRLKDLASDLNVGEKVIFTGFVSENDKWYLFNRCNIFVLPSVVEAFGITVLEAMACSKPVITTNVGPFPEIIKNYSTGILVPKNSPKELAKAIRIIVQDEKLRQNMGEAAKNDIENRFSIIKISDNYLDVYTQFFKTEI